MKIKAYLIFILLILFTSPVVYAIDDNQPCRPFPTVSEDGRLLKDCKPYKAIGVNYFDAFYRVLKNPKDKSYIQGFEKLGKNGIPFVRMMAGGFWPNDWELYFKDKEKYFSLLDEVIKTAEKNNVGIIMTLFWNVSTIPDLMKEPVSAWGDPDSKTINFMKQYTKEVVLRYKDSPAIWGWEFGNEYNNRADLPKKHLPKVAPRFGTPEIRTEKDTLTYRDILTAFIHFANTVREIDKERIISTGNTIPRPSAYHLAFYGTWEKDTVSQFLYMLKLQNPQGYNTISVHLYPTALKRRYFFEKTIYSFKDLISYIMEASRKNKRVLFIGEFGVCEHHAKPEEAEELFIEILKAIEEMDVPLSALWVYDRNIPNDACNVTFENHKAYQLLYIKHQNKRFNEIEIMEHTYHNFDKIIKKLKE